MQKKNWEELPQSKVIIKKWDSKKNWKFIFQEKFKK